MDAIHIAQNTRFASSLLGGTLALAIGCGDPTATSTTADSPTTEAASADMSIRGATAQEEDHGHAPAAHGGTIVSIGRDSYHVEAVFEKGGELRLYTLGEDESRVIDVEQQTLRGFAKAEGEVDAHPFPLQSEPVEGDAEGRTSQFVGRLPEELQGRSLAVTVPNLVISGERFRLGFRSATDTEDEGMPSKVEDEEEVALYLTPGGKYTAEDIEANGNLTASEKFRGIRASHDMNPDAGEKICPVTMTKANPQFTWIVDGKAYEFCCPPCVDEFVMLAKTSPDEIGPPEDYVKQ